MLPLVRSFARFDIIIRLIVVVLLSSLILPLLPGSAGARTELIAIEGTFYPDSATPGQTVTTEVQIRARYSISAVSVHLNVTDSRGGVAHSQTWTDIQLPSRNRPMVLESSYTIPDSATDGEQYRADVRVTYKNTTLAYEEAVADLDVVVNDPPAPTATEVPPTATAEPTATSEPTQPPTATQEPTPTDEPAQPVSVLRVNAGGQEYVDSRGLSWWADGAFDGGSGYIASQEISGTDDDAIYSSERWGTFSYSIPVENGTYDLRLMFAEVWFTEPGQRVFNVDVNGQTVLRGFDILSETAPMTALDKVVPVEVTNGRLDVSIISGRQDYGKLSGFELLSRDGNSLPEPTPPAEPTNTPQPPPTATSEPEPTPTATTPSRPAPTATSSPSPAPSPTPSPTAEPTSTPPPSPPVNPGSTIQEMVDAASPNSTVHVPAGTYREKIYINKPITLIAEPGTIIDGESRDRWIVGQAHNVTIEGFTFINSNQPQYHGGLSNDGYDNWTVRNNIFKDAGNAAIDIKEGSGHLIENNTVTRAGNVGIRVESVGSATIRGNKTSGNNTKNLDPGWEAGGMKITGNYGGVHNLVIENNEAFDNNGPGIWIDVDGQSIEIRNNRVHHNSRAGIIYELSFGGRIHGNVVYNNGSGFDAWGFGAGILIQNSSDTEVFNNVVAWNPDGIVVVSQNRGEARWNNVTGNTIHDNTIITQHDGGWNTYALAWLEDWDGSLSDASSNNRGHNNRFWFTTPEGPELRYRWCGDGYWTAADFSNSPGGQNSQNLSESQKNQVLANAGI